jgi:hypothetical protein
MARRKHSRRHRGGSGSYTSAASYQEYVNGTSVNDQMNRTFGNSVSNNGNLIIGAQGQNSTQTGTPTAAQLSLVQSAGRTRSRRRKGGVWGQVINQAIVPFGLLGLQHAYSKRRSHRKGGSKRRHSKRRHRR